MASPEFDSEAMSEETAYLRQVSWRITAHAITNDPADQKTPIINIESID
jgi:hypothetical protein